MIGLKEGTTGREKWWEPPEKGDARLSLPVK